jgi:hypothetical protein
MEKAKNAEPRRGPKEQAGLSGEQETALLAIEMALSEMRAHGDGMSQWRLAQLGRALNALDRGRHALAMSFVERARMPARRLSERERAEAAKLEQRLELAQVQAAVAARRR